MLIAGVSVTRNAIRDKPPSSMFALIRHAEYDIISGSLSKTAEASTLALADRLQTFPCAWTEVRTSPTPRAFETAAIISRSLAIPVIRDPRIGMDGNYVDLLPPTEPKNMIFISHLPILTQMLRTWSRFFHQEEPPLTQLATGYLVDPDKKEFTPVTASHVA